MKRFFRNVSNAATALSLLLCAGVVVMWVGSYQAPASALHPDSIQSLQGPTWWEFDSDAGYLYVLRAYPDKLKDCTLIMKRDASMQQRLTGLNAYLHGARYTTWGGSLRGIMESAADYSDEPPVLCLGIWKQRRVDLNPRGKLNTISVPVTYRLVTVPYWMIVVLLAILPACCLITTVTPKVRAAHRLRRAKRGLCPACGYDLRATTDRCPECGQPITSNQSDQAPTAAQI